MSTNHKINVNQSHNQCQTIIKSMSTNHIINVNQSYNKCQPIIYRTSTNHIINVNQSVTCSCITLQFGRPEHIS